MKQQTRKTQLYDVHTDAATLTTFAGFEMPLYYAGVIPEHLAVRNSVGIFDISHMGRVAITGQDAEHYLNQVITNDVSRLVPNSAQYSVMCNENGGIRDDFVVYRLEEARFLMVYNASNRQKDYSWLISNVANFRVKVEDVSDSVAMLAVQGPEAVKVLQRISTEDLGIMGRFKCGYSKLADIDVFMARTGYTGEDGFEVFVCDATPTNPWKALKVWKAIMEAGKSSGIEPCGLGARDTLRLEAGLCLYGSDINETITPFEASLGFVVKLQKESFIGKAALERQKSEGITRKRLGILLTEKGIPRSGMEVYGETGEKIGQLTSGTFSPLMKIGVGMAYINVAHAQEGMTVKVKIRERLVKAKTVSFPLYDPEMYGFKRKATP